MPELAAALRDRTFRLSPSALRALVSGSSSVPCLAAAGAVKFFNWEGLEEGPGGEDEEEDDDDDDDDDDDFVSV